VIAAAHLTENERWYLALTALWAARLRAGLPAPGTDQPPEPDVTFAVDVMCLSPGMRVLDLGCAWGRTTRELARRGFDAVGVDLSPELVAIARERAPDVPFAAAPVRCLPDDLGLFDAVTEFYGDSTISYEDEAACLGALRSVAARLRPGGRYLFGTGDHPGALPAHQRTPVRREPGGVDVVEEITFDPATMVGTSVRTHVERGAPPATYRRTRRHYTRDEVAALLARAGFRLLDAWCGYRSELPYGSRAEGLVVLAERDG
jgi:SAM-dependent methyltransferase